MKILGYFVFFILIFFSGLIIWGTDKGFDLSDEGLYVLGLQKSQEIHASYTYYQILLRKIFFFVEFDIITSRIVRFILYLCSSIFFSLSLWKWLAANTKNPLPHHFKVLLISFITTGTFVSYSFCAQSISYNHLSTVILLFASGCIFLFAKKMKSENYNSLHVFPILLGILSTLEIFVKPTTGVILILIFPLFLLIYKKFIQTMIFFLCGVFLAFVIYFSLVQLPDEYYNGIKTIAYLNSLVPSYSLSYISEDIHLTALIISKLLFYSFLSAFFFSYIKKAMNKYIHEQILFSNVIFLLYFITVFFLMHTNILLGYFHSKRASYFLILFILFISITTTESLINIRFSGIVKLIMKNYTILLLMIFLFLCPIILAVGTNNGLLLNAIFGLCFWFAAAISIYYLFPINRFYTSIYILSSVFLATYMFGYYFIYHPYRIENLYLQTETIPDLKNAGNIKFDIKTKKYIEQISDLLNKNGFKNGGPIIGIYRLPGLIYLVGGLSPGSILWSDEMHTLFSENLKNSGADLKKSFILIRDEYSPDFMNELKSYNIDFSKYKKVGEARWDLWENPITSVYAPMNENL